LVVRFGAGSGLKRVLRATRVG